MIKRGLSYNGFSYTHQKSIPHHRGLVFRNFSDLNLQYKRKICHLWQNHIAISGQSGLNWRFEGTENFNLFYWRYYSVSGTLIEEEKEYGYYLFDLGLSLGASARIKLFKGLFTNVQSNYTRYLIGSFLGKDASDIKKSNQVISATLSLGYSF
jgi:hypothetical protein